MASVFLSYSREDVAKAEAVAAKLENLGHSVWWDRQVQGGSRFSIEIEQALKGADAILVLWSRASVRSAWVTDEAAEGRDSGRLVPVVIDDSKPPLGFRQYQAIDLSGWKGRNSPGAIDAVHQAIVAKSGAAQADQAPPKARNPRRDYRRFGIGAAASLLVLAVAALIYWFAGPVAPSDRGALRLRLAEVAALSQEVPREVPETLREEMLAALATDAVIIATTDQKTGQAKAGYALTASVRKTGDLLRFMVHVINERTGGTVWTQSLDRPAAIADIAPRQVAVAVSQMLRCGLGGVARYGKPMPDETLSIYMNFCEEYWAETAGKETNASRAVDLARRLTEAAPDFSRGWSALAEVATWAGSGNKLQSAAAVHEEAVRAAEKALKFDKDNSEAYQALASLQPPFAFAEREKLHIKSISVRPSDCGCEYVGYGGFLNRVGRNAEAVDAFRRAHDMIPLSADVNAGFVQSLLVVGRERDARELVTGVFELWPDYSYLREILLRGAFWTGRYDEGLKLIADPKTAVTEQERVALAKALRAVAGHAAGDAGLIEQLSKFGAESATLGPLFVTALAALGANDQALSLAAVQVQREGSRALPVLFEPSLAAARRSPQFTQIVQRFGLVDYWRKSRRKPDFCKEASPPQLCGQL